jgi:hypothetical protein
MATALLSCGGGSETVANPFTGTGPALYQGPPPANADVRAFEIYLWENLKADNRCGQCHGVGQVPAFVDLSDVNTAYTNALPLVDLQDPAGSRLVAKVGLGHNCWLGLVLQTDFDACAANIEAMITNWSGSIGSLSARTINLTAPAIKDPGASRNFPEFADDNGANSFANTIHPLLTAHCQSCHEETASLPISPFFANADAASAYEAAKPKIDIDDPANSRLVVRLREEFHNCWTTNCADDSDPLDPSDSKIMENAIQAFSGVITPTQIESSLITSKALNLSDGIIASGGNRHESNMIAIWEFKAGAGDRAFDTSGIEPAIDLTLSGSYAWLGGYGIDLSGGKALGGSSTSRKLYDLIVPIGEYSIEAWAIPANVTQEDTNIVTYSAGNATIQRNFTLDQSLYNYKLFNRINASNPVSEISTPDADEILQANLQHVVATYDPVNGRSIYVNGALVPGIVEPVIGSSSIANWDETFNFILGGEVSSIGARAWNGKLRMVAMHNRVLTPAQVLQNFDVGVGEKYFLLFSISDRIGIPDSYIMFEVSQFDSYSYLFDKPVFINLDPNWAPVSFDIKGLRIGVNGKEAVAGQTFANMDLSIESNLYSAQTGQPLSSLGAVIALEKGPGDEFFLTFETLDGTTNAFNDPKPAAPGNPADAAAVSDIGIRTFEEINASISAITGISTADPEVVSVFDGFKQQFPTVESIDTFLPSHQMAITQLALASCKELVDAEVASSLPINDTNRYFTGFNFGLPASTAFVDPGLIIDPLIIAAMNVDRLAPGNNLTSQPTEPDINNVLGDTNALTLDPTIETYNGLITEMTACLPGCDNATRTEQIVIAVCTAAVSSATMLIQ